MKVNTIHHWIDRFMILFIFHTLPPILLPKNFQIHVFIPKYSLFILKKIFNISYAGLFVHSETRGFQKYLQYNKRM